MGQWVNCEVCQGTGTIPCVCSEKETCVICHGSGRRICSHCHGSGRVYRNDGDGEEEYEFVYDEY